MFFSASYFSKKSILHKAILAKLCKMRFKSCKKIAMLSLHAAEKKRQDVSCKYHCVTRDFCINKHCCRNAALLFSLTSWRTVAGKHFILIKSGIHCYHNVPLQCGFFHKIAKKSKKVFKKAHNSAAAVMKLTVLDIFDIVMPNAAPKTVL